MYKIILLCISHVIFFKVNDVQVPRQQKGWDRGRWDNGEVDGVTHRVLCTCSLVPRLFFRTEREKIV